MTRRARAGSPASLSSLGRKCTATVLATSPQTTVMGFSHRWRSDTFGGPGGAEGYADAHQGDCTCVLHGHASIRRLRADGAVPRHEGSEVGGPDKFHSMEDPEPRAQPTVLLCVHGTKTKRHTEAALC